jgi:hypothetical protein
MLNIIDDFLPAAEHHALMEALLGFNFPWFYNGFKADPEPGAAPLLDARMDFQFTHIFYLNHTINSPHFALLSSLVERLNPAALVRVKANLTTYAQTVTEHNMHTDPRAGINCTTAIYYLNTTNGPTMFADGQRVDCVANRLVTFDSRLKHAASTHTDCKVRGVINLNYF